MNFTADFSAILDVLLCTLPVVTIVTLCCLPGMQTGGSCQNE